MIIYDFADMHINKKIIKVRIITLLASLCWPCPEVLSMKTVWKTIPIVILLLFSVIPGTVMGTSAAQLSGSMTVKVTDWGNVEYDVTLSLSSPTNWEVYVELTDGAQISSYWSVNKEVQGDVVILTPPSWNQGPSATFGMIVQNGKVKSMKLVADGQVLDVWPSGASVSNETSNQTSGNETSGGSSNGTSNNQTSGNETSGGGGNVPSNETNGTSGNVTDNTTTGNTTSNQTSDNETSGGVGSNETSGNLIKPGAISVKTSNWGSTEYDVTLDLGGTYDWVLKVKLKKGSTVTSSWSVNKAEQDGYVIFTPVSWNKGPTASFGFIATGSEPVEYMILEVNGQTWDVWPENAPLPTPSNNTTPSPSPSPQWFFITNPNDTGNLYMAYKVLGNTSSTLTVELVLANKNTHYVWNGYYFDVKNVTFETSGRITSIGYSDGGSPEYTVNGSRVILDLTWRGMFPLNTSVSILMTIEKAGENPLPHNFVINYVRGPVLYPTTGKLPGSWKPGNFTINDLIESPAEYYSSNVKPHSNGFIMYNPPSRTQIIIGLANITYPLNLAKSSKMWVPNKYFAMSLALAYEWFKVNPNFLMALAAKENWGTALTQDPSFTGINVTYRGEKWNWPIVINHPDGVFQVEKGNFNQIKKYYPDIFPENADHEDYMQVSLDSKDTAWITSPITATLSLTMERELLYAALGEKYNEFLRNAKDPWAETEIIDFGYNRGMGSLAALKIFSDNWEKAINAPVLWEAFGMSGFGGHVPTVINVTATMDAETRDIYDANLTWQDIEYFFGVIRQKFFRQGAISDSEWKEMMNDVHRAYDLLSQHWGGNHVSYRYDFLTILRVAMSHWPHPLIPRPTGNDWYYNARNYKP